MMYIFVIVVAVGECVINIRDCAMAVGEGVVTLGECVVTVR